MKKEIRVDIIDASMRESEKKEDSPKNKEFGSNPFLKADEKRVSLKSQNLRNSLLL